MTTTGDNTPEDPRPEEIREEIEQTRLEMSETIDALQERLNPDHVKEQAIGAVRAATIGRAEEALGGAGQSVKGTSSRMIDSVKQNPIPAAMIGIGVGWLIMRSRSSAGSAQASPQGQQRLGDVTSAGKEQAAQTVGQVQQQASQAVSQAQQRAEQTASQLQDTAGRVSQRTRGQFNQLQQENPLALGGVALALGLAVGLAVPGTQKEQQVMGEARDKLVDQARSRVEETQQKVQRVAEEAQKAATEEAKNQELAP